MTVEQKLRGVSGSETSLLMRVRRNVRLTSARDSRTSVVQYFAKDATNNEVFYFGEQELFLCQLLDGTRSFEDVQGDFEAKFGTRLTKSQLSAFIQELSEAGLLEPANSSDGEAGSWKVEPADATAPPEEPDAAAVRTPFRWRLFDPSGLFRATAAVFWPSKYIVWLLLPAIVMAGLTLFHHQNDVVNDIVNVAATHSVGSLVLFVTLLFAYEFLVRSAEGTVATAFGAPIKEFGIQLTGGVIPRLYVETRPIWQQPRRARLWTCAAPLLMRLAIFSVATFVWIAFRPAGTALSQFALITGQIAFWAFVVTSIPLIPSDGYRWLAEYLDQPLLIDRAMRLLGMKWHGRRTPEALTPREKWGLLLFAAGVVIATTVYAAAILLYIGTRLELRFNGAGAAMFAVVAILALTWFYSGWLSVQSLRAAKKIDPAAAVNVVTMPKAQPAKTGLVAAPARLPNHDIGGPLQFRAAPRASPTNYRLYAIRAAFLGACAIIAFLPYPYEAGGDFSILPSARVDVRARVDGEVMNVFVREGDWVQRGQVMGVLSDWNEVRDLTLTKASLEKAQADLQRLRDGAKSEAIDLAQKQVDAAQSRIAFSKAEADRQSQLLRSGITAKREVEAAISEYNKNVADLAVAQANLDLVKSSTQDSTIAASEAEVRRLEEQYRYLQDEVDRTRLRAPVSGRVVTKDLELTLGNYLNVGGLFAELEDSRVAQAEILVPETDIAQVQVGERVRLKPWGYSDREIIGKITAIAPVAEKVNYGLVVRVKTELPNDGGLLKPQMTGFAKIEGSEMPVWEAYTRLIVRFFRIEVWSWIP